MACNYPRRKIPIETIAELKKYGFCLLVDDSHGFGIPGKMVGELPKPMALQDNNGYYPHNTKVLSRLGAVAIG